MKTIVPAAILVIGMLLIGISLVWTLIFPPGQGWTTDKAKRMTELGNQATTIRLQLNQAEAKPSMHAGQNPAELKAKFEEINAEYKTLYDDFTTATQGPKSSTQYLRWTGVACALLGGVAVMATRDK